MKIKHFIIVLLFDLISVLAKSGYKINEIYVEKCEQAFADNQPYPARLCQMRKLKMQKVTSITEAYVECVLTQLGYLNSEGKIDGSAVLADYHKFGVTDKDDAVQNLLKACEEEFGSDDKSVFHRLCIKSDRDFTRVINARTTTEGWIPKKSVC
uniref:Putative salivary short d7 protein 4 n=1 Tax=Culex tarsalis TaxID=7177 RepID=A0A1Q3FHS7_CULTA